MSTPIAKCLTTNDKLVSFMIEINEEIANEHLDDPHNIIEDNSILTLTSNDFDNLNDLPLIHPQLLDWDLPEHVPMDTFQNDDAFINYLGIQDDLPLGDHKAGYIIELNSATYFGEGVRPSSRKKINIKTKYGYHGENHVVVLFDPKKVKRKDVSKGENLSEASEDGRFNTLPMTTYEEK